MVFASSSAHRYLLVRHHDAMADVIYWLTLYVSKRSTKKKENQLPFELERRSTTVIIPFYKTMSDEPAIRELVLTS